LILFENIYEGVRMTLSMPETLVSADSPLERLLLWERGKTPGPWRVHIEIGARADDPKTASAEFEHLSKFADECAARGAREWMIVVRGDSPNSDSIATFCEKIRGFGMNGTLLFKKPVFADEAFTKILAAKWAEIAFRLDGAYREINDPILGEGTYDNVKKAIRRIEKIRFDRKFDATTLSLFTELTDANYDQMERIAELAHNLCCDKIHLSIPGGRCSKRLSPENEISIPALLLTAEQCAERLSVVTNFRDYLPEPEESDAVLWRRFKGEQGKLSSAPCFAPWLGLSIDTEGFVRPCAQICDSPLDEGGENVREKGVDAVWIGPCMRRIREEMARGHALASCCCKPSQMRAENEILSRRLRWASMNRVQRLLLMFAKARRGARRHGFRRSITRAREWLTLQRAKR
jgi:hypothetical protein